MFLDEPSQLTFVFLKMRLNILVGLLKRALHTRNEVCITDTHFGSCNVSRFISVGDKYYRNKSKMDWSEDAADMEDDGDDTAQQEVKLEKKYSQATKATVDLLDERIIPYDLIIRTLERLCFEDASSIQFSAAVLIFMPGLAEIRRLHDLLIEHPLFGVTSGFRIFPLHSMISSENQAAVFEIPPAGVRKIVICKLLPFFLVSLSNTL